MLVERIDAANKAKYGPKATISQLEAAVGLGNGLIKKWENSSPKVENILKVADYLDVSIDYLCGRTEIKNPPASGGSAEEKTLVKAWRAADDDHRNIAAVALGFEYKCVHEEKKDASEAS